MVTLGKPDQPAKPPPARAGSGMTKEAMLAELEAWHASSGLEGALTPDCHDPDPPISRALVDARHTFLEMCQVRNAFFFSFFYYFFSRAMNNAGVATEYFLSTRPSPL